MLFAIGTIVIETTSNYLCKYPCNELLPNTFTFGLKYHDGKAQVRHTLRYVIVFIIGVWVTGMAYGQATEEATEPVAPAATEAVTEEATVELQPTETPFPDTVIYATLPPNVTEDPGATEEANPTTATGAAYAVRYEVTAGEALIALLVFASLCVQVVEVFRNEGRVQ